VQDWCFGHEAVFMYLSDRLLFVKRNSKLAYLTTHCQLLSMCSIGDMNECVWGTGGMILTGNLEVFGEKSVPMPFCPPHMPYGLTWDRTLASIVRRVSSMYSDSLRINWLVVCSRRRREAGCYLLTDASHRFLLSLHTVQTLMPRQACLCQL